MKKILFILFFLGGKLFAQNIAVSEYFWDTDPGPGLAIPSVVLFPLDTVSMNAEVSTSGLTSGAHVLYFRTQDENGKWSLSEGRPVTIVSSVIALEYFWDTDPGINAGFPISVVIPFDSLNLFAAISTAGLGTGTHYLYLRSKDNFNKWSLTEGRPVNIIQSVVKAEYFWDIDPGIGTGIPIVLNVPADSLSFNSVVSTIGLSVGQHYLYVRTCDNAGKWSLSEGRSIMIQPSVVAAEFFWDADPGMGFGIPMNAVTPDDSINLNAIVSTTGLSMGVHTLYARTKDHSGKWSLAEGRTITVNSSIVAAEYFWDTDPGFGLGNNMTVQAFRDSISLAETISTTGLAEGVHYLYTRTQDNGRKWSLSEGRPVTIGSSIVAAEYFWDTDPGFGLASPIEIPGAPLDSINFLQSLSTCGLTSGAHYLFVRTKDNSGRWSLAEPRLVNITPNASPCPNLNFRAFLQGIYTGGRAMRTTLFDLGMSTNERVTDSVLVELWSPADLSVPAYSQRGLIRSNGAIQMEFPADVFGNMYYVVFHHRSSIETWTKEPVLFNAYMVSLDMTSP